MVTIDFDGPIEEYHKTGIYFKPQSHQCMHYMVSFAIQYEGQCKASIFTIGIPQRNGREFAVEIGVEIAAISTYEHVMDIDIWGKYYFPEFMSQQQWYHDTGNEDYIASLAEVMRFALAKGLEFGNITPY